MSRLIYVLAVLSTAAMFLAIGLFFCVGPIGLLCGLPTAGYMLMSVLCLGFAGALIGGVASSLQDYVDDAIKHPSSK